MLCIILTKLMKINTVIVIFNTRISFREKLGINTLVLLGGSFKCWCPLAQNVYSQGEYCYSAIPFAANMGQYSILT